MEKKQRELNNKGFSLIELIVVIAIMAILVGVMAPNVIKYIKSANESNDKQNLSTVYSAVTVAIADAGTRATPVDVPAWDKQELASSTGDFSDIVKEILGGSLTVKLKSDLAGDKKVLVSIGNNNKVTVVAGRMQVDASGYTELAAVE